MPEACGACGYYKDPNGPPHVNVCRRHTCTRCGVRFALFPDPLSKQYGKAALCTGCLSASRPQPDYARAVRVTPEGADKPEA